MKDNFENNIKESLDGFEMPYDAAAWDSISKRLDQTMPSSGKNNYKWYFGGAAVLAVVITSVLFWPTTTENKLIVSQSTNTTNPEQDKSLASKSNVNQTTSTENTVSSTNSVVKNESNEAPVKSLGEQVDKNTYQNINQILPISWIEIDVNQPNQPRITENSKPTLFPTIAPLCIGEKTTIVNENKQAILLSGPFGSITIKGKSSYSFIPELEGVHELGYMENEAFIVKESFTVKSAPKVDFTIDDNYQFDGGVPTTYLTSNVQGQSYSWSFEGQNGAITGHDASVHYFKKGTYDINLSVTGTNGCKASATKPLQINDNYNLMAQTGFDPASLDNRVNSFVPSALLLRNTDFRMIIIDPTDGGIVFETSDVTNPWRGIDKRNGQMVNANKAFIWKVTLSNPLKGESPEYKGTIVRI